MCTRHPLAGMSQYADADDGVLMADPLIRRTAELAEAFLDSADERTVGAPVTPLALRERLGGRLPEQGEDPVSVIEWLARQGAPGRAPRPGPRYFGFVLGGSHA